MTVPLIRQYNSALVTVGVPVNATDAITGETQLQLSNDNVIEDFVNSPDTANAGDLIQTELFINQLQAGPAFFSVSSSPLTAGRQPVGPIPISAQGGKQISYRSQAQATVTALPYTYTFQIRYRNFF
tara:strand:- start:1240 stop:1620 length:381 start_codon:yes stop_codon:yes gene_type:complete